MIASYGVVVKATDDDVRRESSKNTVLVGGSSLIGGMDERVINEMLDVLPVSMRPQANIPRKPQQFFFSGTTMLANSSKTEYHWMKKEDYEEWGAVGVHRFCF